MNEEAEKLKKEQVQKQLEESEKMTRLSLANEAYETWIELKESEREFIADFVLIEAPPIPWLPPSNLIPRQFVRSSNGNRLVLLLMPLLKSNCKRASRLIESSAFG